MAILKKSTAIAIIISLFVGHYANSQRSISPSKTERSISIDGKLTEAVWSEASFQSEFQMQKPVDDQAATQITEVALAYDNNNLYIAAKCYDDPKYVISTLKRDNFGDDDSFAVFIDPNNQKTNGYGFGINAKGAMSESFISESQIDDDWDNVWYGATYQNNGYYSVEIRIPFKTLRFNDALTTWGINFVRLDPGNNETSSWSPTPRQFEFYNLTFLGNLEWKEPPSSNNRNIAIIPYITTANKTIGDNSSNNIDFGADAKVAVTDNLNLDLTINPDFSNVEVDNLVTNLERFSVFLPEKRQFFLENADIFRFGMGANQPFYSRRIGLGKNANPVPILFGARLTGNANNKLRVGLMNITNNPEDSDTQNNYTVASFQQRVGKLSSVRGIYINRESLNDEKGSPNRFGRNLGLELNLATPNRRWVGQIGGIQSFKPNIEHQKNHHIYGQVAYNGVNFRSFLQLEQVGRNYYTDLGFNARILNFNPITGTTSRIGYSRIANNIDYYIYPKNSNSINFHWSGLENYITINEDTGLNDWYTRLRHFLFFKNTSELRFRLNHRYVDLVFPFDILDDPIPADEYRMVEFNIEYRSDRRSAFNYSLFSVYGQFYSGHKWTNNVDLGYRFQPWINVAIGLESNYITLPDNQGKGNLWGINSRTEISFSTNLYWTTLLQYNKQQESIGINTRLQWRYSPMSDLYLVYTKSNNDLFPQFNSQSISLKCSYWLGI